MSKEYQSVYTGQQIDEKLGKIDNLLDNQINVVTVSLSASAWTVGADGRYSQTVSVANVTPTTKVVVVDVDLSTDDADAKVAYLEAWQYPSANEVDQGDGTLTFYAWEQPTVNIPLNVVVM